MLSNESADPFAAMTAPPHNESPEHRTTRLAAEAEAKRRSDAIEEVLRAERVVQRSRKPVKLLLLGQSESGACAAFLLRMYLLNVKYWAQGNRRR
jgi:guanine nucleotide-binding protein alpha-1 subunit